MNTLTEKQNLRYELLKVNRYDVANSKACYDFIEGESGKVSNEPKTDNKELADGIYIMLDNGAAILFTGQNLSDTEKSNCTGIGVKLGCKSLVVALGDMTDDEITLTTKEGGTRFINKFDKAVADWGGKENTDDIRGILNSDIVLADCEHIPSLGELHFILLHKAAINEALVAVGGLPLCGWYWSSTEFSAANAWNLHLGNGLAIYYAKATIQGRVRPVSAFLPLNS